jgi:hypothetical protein
VKHRGRFDVARRVGQLEDKLGGRDRCGCIVVKAADEYPVELLPAEPDPQFWRTLSEPCPDHGGQQRLACYTAMFDPSS